MTLHQPSSLLSTCRSHKLSPSGPPPLWLCLLSFPSLFLFSPPLIFLTVCRQSPSLLCKWWVTMADGPLSCLVGYLFNHPRVEKVGDRREEGREGKVQDERRCDRKRGRRNKVWHTGSVCVTCRFFWKGTCYAFLFYNYNYKRGGTNLNKNRMQWSSSPQSILNKLCPKEDDDGAGSCSHAVSSLHDGALTCSCG